MVVVVVVVDVDPAVESLLATYPGGVSPKLLLSDTFAALGALDVLGAFYILGALDALTSFGAFAFTA